MKKVFRVYGTAHYDAYVMVEAETAEEALGLAVEEGQRDTNVPCGDLMEFLPADAEEVS